MTDLIICLIIAVLIIFAVSKLKKSGGCGCNCKGCNKKCNDRRDEDA